MIEQAILIFLCQFLGIPSLPLQLNSAPELKSATLRVDNFWSGESHIWMRNSSSFEYDKRSLLKQIYYLSDGQKINFLEFEYDKNGRLISIKQVRNKPRTIDDGVQIIDAYQLTFSLEYSGESLNSVSIFSIPEQQTDFELNKFDLNFVTFDTSIVTIRHQAGGLHIQCLPSGIGCFEMDNFFSAMSVLDSFVQFNSTVSDDSYYNLQDYIGPELELNVLLKKNMSRYLAMSVVFFKENQLDVFGGPQESFTYYWEEIEQNPKFKDVSFIYNDTLTGKLDEFYPQALFAIYKDESLSHVISKIK